MELITKTVEETEKIGSELGQLLRPNDLICLHGELGAGKTAFVRGVARGWGTKTRVTSPTFTLINQYSRSDQTILYHVDAYRLESWADVVTTGFEDILDSGGIVIIEWAERVQSFLSAQRLDIFFSHLDETSRTIRIVASGERPQQLLGLWQSHFSGAM